MSSSPVNRFARSEPSSPVVNIRNEMFFVEPVVPRYVERTDCFPKREYVCVRGKSDSKNSNGSRKKSTFLFFLKTSINCIRLTSFSRVSADCNASSAQRKSATLAIKSFTSLVSDASIAVFWRTKRARIRHRRTPALPASSAGLNRPRSRSRRSRSRP